VIEDGAIPAVPLHEAGQDGNECSLAAAGGSFQHEQLSGADFQIDAPQSLDGGVSGTVGPGYARAANGWLLGG
jgi:hypothetical protein